MIINKASDTANFKDWHSAKFTGPINDPLWDHVVGRSNVRRIHVLSPENCRTKRPNREPQRVGYARVSTDEQTVNAQVDALDAVGCDIIFCDDGLSAIASNRTDWNEALAYLREGDTLVIQRLDRAFRSTVEAILTLADLMERGVEFRCLAMQIDTSTPEGRKWYRDTASWAEYERELISERTKAGLAAVRARGTRLGRPWRFDLADVEAMQIAHRNGESIRSLARRYGCKPETIKRNLARLKGKP